MDKIPGHEEAMKNLISSMEDKETDFSNWEQRLKAREAVLDAREKALKEAGETWAEVAESSARKGILTRYGKKLLKEGARYYAKVPIAENTTGKKNPWQPIREEIYAPPPELMKEAKKRGLKFTVGEKYPVYAEILEANYSAGVRYVTKDDEGNRRSVNSIHFNTEARLAWPDLIEDNTTPLPLRRSHKYSVDMGGTVEIQMPEIEPIQTHKCDRVWDGLIGKTVKISETEPVVNEQFISQIDGFLQSKYNEIYKEAHQNDVVEIPSTISFYSSNVSSSPINGHTINFGVER